MELDQEPYGPDNDRPYRWTGLQVIEVTQKVKDDWKTSTYQWEWNSVDGFSLYSGRSGKKLKRIPKDVMAEMEVCLKAILNTADSRNINNYPIWENATEKTTAIAFNPSGYGWYMTAKDLLLYKPDAFIALMVQESIKPAIKIPLKFDLPFFFKK